ncbi:quercetin dioxygenase-like cupin family protein [Pseudoxanthomonas sp. 3HH-4]|uniref:cupin domain-containing protein n=1 Tax=Pseudoxanthomonas sp. 3HH-4 TaxID=1690214 RepID=UPI0011532CA1|nr:cupin domain-containing protein [Pseudoxanthomonas sp. 3HH-4]TQM12124.1 quercetin dioxygenase-like cupin family protein [Pseudoxanthomonas sp. 3HH-4]
MKTTKHALIAATLLALTATSLWAANAQPAGIGRHEALRHDLDVPGREVVQVRVDFAPGAAFGMHTHPGIEVAYVLEGSLAYTFEDAPPVTLKAGQSLFIPAGTPHAAHNPGNTPAAELATYLVEKDKPIVALHPAR